MKRVFGLIGYPLEHSWSKKYFNQKFSDENIVDSHYENFPLKDLSLFKQTVEANPNLVGLNITIPYKQKIIPYLDELDLSALKVGAVNSIKIIREKKKVRLVGFNTDVVGFEGSLINNDVSLDCNALVLGSGGASLAVRFVLEKLGLPNLVVSRNPKDEGAISYNQLNDRIICNHGLIINTTPLGMFPDVGSFPDIPYDSLKANHVLFDLVYNPTETVFLKKGKKSGCKTINGLEMLELQAVESWRIWNEQPQG